jgi:hypothetical protein
LASDSRFARFAAAPLQGSKAHHSDPLVGPMKVSYLTFRFFAGNSVPLLYSADKLILFPFNGLPIIVGQFTPFFLCLPNELFPVSLDLVGIHL